MISLHIAANLCCGGKPILQKVPYLCAFWLAVYSIEHCKSRRDAAAAEANPVWDVNLPRNWGRGNTQVTNTIKSGAEHEPPNFA